MLQKYILKYPPCECLQIIRFFHTNFCHASENIRCKVCRVEVNRVFVVIVLQHANMIQIIDQSVEKNTN